MELYKPNVCMIAIVKSPDWFRKSEMISRWPHFPDPASSCNKAEMYEYVPDSVLYGPAGRRKAGSKRLSC